MRRVSLFLFLLVLCMSALPSTAYAQFDKIDTETWCAWSNKEINSDVLIEKAKKRGIALKADSGVPIDPHLLYFTLKWLKERNINDSFQFYFSADSSPIKVKIDASTLRFSSDAGDMLITKKMREILSEEVCQGFLASLLPQVAWIEYSNTLNEQMSRALSKHLPPSKLKEMITQEYGLRLDAQEGDSKDPLLFDEGFNNEEIITLHKQLQDLPVHVVKKMELASVLRVRRGVSLGKDVAAQYDVMKKSIHVSSNMFADHGNSLGEDSFLHELGHAYWFGMSNDQQASYAELSWTSQNGKLLFDDSKGSHFVSDYSTKNPEEDFAEHFSAYVNQPELLKTKAANKYEFLKNKVFIDHEYFLAAHSSAKVRVQSSDPDSNAPKLTRKMEVSVLALTSKENGVSYVEFKVTHIAEDKSGLEPLTAIFTHKNPLVPTNLKVPLQVETDSQTGLYTLLGKVAVDPTFLVPGEYFLKNLSLEDQAKNKRSYNTAQITKIQLEGLIPPVPNQVPEFDVRQIKIVKIGENQGHPIYDIEVPVKHDSYNIASMKLHWIIDNERKETVHPYEMVPSPAILSAEGDSIIRVHSSFKADYPTSRIFLSNVEFATLSNANGFGVSDNTKILNENEKEISMIGKSDKWRLLDADPDKLQLTPPPKDGYLVGVSIPLLNREYGTAKVTGTLVAPDGKRFSGMFKEEIPSSPQQSASAQANFNITLPPHAPDGFYILSELQIETQYPVPPELNHTTDKGTPTLRTIKLVERGIRRGFVFHNNQVLSKNDEIPLSAYTARLGALREGGESSSQLSGKGEGQSEGSGLNSVGSAGQASGTAASGNSSEGNSSMRQVGSYVAPKYIPKPRVTAAPAIPVFVTPAPRAARSPSAQAYQAPSKSGAPSSLSNNTQSQNPPGDFDLNGNPAVPTPKAKYSVSDPFQLIGYPPAPKPKHRETAPPVKQPKKETPKPAPIQPDPISVEFQ